MSVAEVTTVLARFEQRCARLGVAVRRVGRGETAIAAAVVEALDAVGARSCVVADDVGDERDAIARAISDTGMVLMGGTQPRALESAAAGVSRAAFAVAETGSVAVVGNDLQPRLATMIVPTHVVLVSAEHVLGSLDEAGAEIERLMADRTRYVSLVTGPSRTADVEKTLAVGVHGPSVVRVVLIGDN